jgi:4-amino-4-deoxy-L-arabinose transferase-like glycosyltransferase
MINNKAFYSVLLLCLVTYLLAMLLVPLMDVDASQYASISREMLERKSFLQIYDQGVDYLDKPPLLFWLSAASMYIFGVHDWAYRLPSIIMLLVAIYATYRFAKLYYEEAIARLSAMVLASSQALFLMAHDVRTDTMLMGWVMLSIWQLSAWFQTNKWKQLIIGFASIGAGMMTKGPVALMVPGFAFAFHFLLHRNWKQFFRWEYLLGIVIIGIMLIPMCIGLYQQYDVQPGKLINGIPIQSGLRFYFWTQSFGRYTGENFYNEMSYFTFLLENMLWSFLPWIVFFLGALIWKAISAFKFRKHTEAEWISIGGFVLTYCILAKSQAQLPHYIFVVFPLAAVITADFLYAVFFKQQFGIIKKILTPLHLFIFSLLWVAVAALLFIPFKSIPIYVPVLSLIGLPVLWFLFFSKKISLPTLLETAFFTVIGVNIFLVTAFYPNLLKYQMGNDAVSFLEKSTIDKKQVSMYNIHNSNALHFYGKHIFAVKNRIGDYKTGDIMLTVKDSALAIKNRFPTSEILHEGPNYGVSVLSADFLNPVTRDKNLPKYVMIKLGNN